MEEESGRGEGEGLNTRGKGGGGSHCRAFLWEKMGAINYTLFASPLYSALARA